MMVTCHSKMLASSTNPAENPSTGFLLKSGRMSARRGVRSRVERIHIPGEFAGSAHSPRTLGRTRTARWLREER